MRKVETTELRAIEAGADFNPEKIINLAVDIFKGFDFNSKTFTYVGKILTYVLDFGSLSDLVLTVKTKLFNIFEISKDFHLNELFNKSQVPN